MEFAEDIVVPPVTIRTEDNPNSGIGTDQGYQEHEGVKYFIFYTCPGWSGMILFTGIGAESGKSGWSEYYMTEENHLDLGTIGFSQEDKPTVPSKPKARQLPKKKSVLVTWKGELGVTYLVYRSTMWSGADNGHSNGEYQLVGMTDSSFFVDKNVPSGISVWYVLLAKYDSNNDPTVLSGHSEESDEIVLP